MKSYNAKNHNYQPYVSVIMASYNSSAYIASAIESILGQTFLDFEFIIIDDASTDRTEDIVKKYTDKRIRFIKEEKRIKQAACRNTGISQARGVYIAIMDSDDIAIPQRLAAQSAFLDDNPKVAIVGSWHYRIDKEGNLINLAAKPESDSQIKLLIALKTKQSCFCHSATMFRKDSFLAIGGYDEEASSMEDRDLWIRLAAKGYVFTNLSTPLLKKRVGTSFSQENILKEEAYRKQREIIYLKNRIFLESLLKKYKKFPIEKIPLREFTAQERGAYADFYIKLGLGLLYRASYGQARAAFIEAIKCAHKPSTNFAKTSYMAYFFFLETLGVLKIRPLRRIYYTLMTATSGLTYFMLLQEGNFSKPPSTLTILFLFFRTFFYQLNPISLIGMKRRPLLKDVFEMTQPRMSLKEEVSLCVDRIPSFVDIFDFEQGNFLIFKDATNTISPILGAKGKNVMYAESDQELQRIVSSGNRFDCAFCLSSLEELTDPIALLRKFITILNSGGYAYFYFYGQHHSAVIRKIQNYSRVSVRNHGAIRRVFFRQMTETNSSVVTKGINKETNNNKRISQAVSRMELLYRKD